MASLAYRRLYEMNKIEARKELVKTYQETGSISATARLWNTSRQVMIPGPKRRRAKRQIPPPTSFPPSDAGRDFVRKQALADADSLFTLAGKG